MRLNNVAIEFHEDATSNGLDLYDWNDRSVDACTIFVDQELRDRFDRIPNQENSNSHEYQCIVFAIAAALVHEWARLIQRWQGVSDNLSTFRGVIKNYVEGQHFSGLYHLQIQKTTRRKI